MRIIDRYVIREVLLPFVIALLVFTFILIVPSMMQYAEAFIAKGVPTSIVLRAMATLLPSSLALSIPSAVLAGYDWGGRGACIVSALWPERVTGLVSCGSYNIHNIASALTPDTPDNEHRLWYQYYFNTERGRVGLERNPKAICRFLWETWSPTWKFTTETYERTAASFDNPDFVDVVIHSYRHRIGNAPGEPRFLETEKRLARGRHA